MKNRIEIKPLSVNTCYRGRRFKTENYARYCRDIAFLAPKLILPTPPYQIHLKFGFSNDASDWDNCIKTTQDALADKYKFNDKLIRKGIVETEKVPRGKEYIEFEITSLSSLPAKAISQ